MLPDLDGNKTRNHRPFTKEDELGYSTWINDIGPMGVIDGNKYMPVVYDEAVDGRKKAAAHNDF